MFWIGYIAGLLTPVVVILLTASFNWIFSRGTRVTCPCGKVYGVMHQDVRDGMVNDDGEVYKRPSLDRVTDLQVSFHQLTACPLRKAAN